MKHSQLVLVFSNLVFTSALLHTRSVILASLKMANLVNCRFLTFARQVLRLEAQVEEEDADSLVQPVLGALYRHCSTANVPRRLFQICYHRFFASVDLRRRFFWRFRALP